MMRKVRWHFKCNVCLDKIKDGQVIFFFSFELDVVLCSVSLIPFQHISSHTPIILRQLGASPPDPKWTSYCKT